MSNLPLGQIITTPQQRDAIHVAVLPIEAGRSLRPGKRVRVDENGRAIRSTGKDVVGVVDPFLEDTVEKGETFWLFLLPQTITSLRHDWSSPAFPAAPVTAVAAPAPEQSTADRSLYDAVRAIQAAADDAGLDYGDMMTAAIDYLNTGEYLIDGGRWEGHYLPGGFWDAFQKVTGRHVPEDKRGSFFSCSC